MTETAPEDRAHATLKPRAVPIISARSLLLRLLICVVTIVTMSIGGAWLMHAAIDPAADRRDGAAAQELSVEESAITDRFTAFGDGLRAVTPTSAPAAHQ